VTTPIQALLISGSLRRGSTNSAVLRTASAVAPPSVAGSIFEGMADLPAFNADLDVDPLPGPVAELRTRIHHADVVLLSTPEYAGALPGSFKNLLDWTIGDDRPGSIYDKPVAWINASPRGASEAHRSLRLVLGYAHARLVEAACRHLPVIAEQIGPDGLIADAQVRRGLTASLVELGRAARGPSEPPPRSTGP
jgi:chromate reductase, NAD(P)H dehydrogenase (quinone)